MPQTPASDCGTARWADCTYFVYILASGSLGTLYIGVTNSLLFRVEQHRAGKGGKFTRRYKVTQLVWFEEHASIEEAIQREKGLKRYLRDWKINLIQASNPHWTDLFPELQRRHGISGSGDS